MKTPVLVAGIAVTVAVSALAPGLATAQRGERWGGRWRGQGYGSEPSYQSSGYGYQSPGYGYGAPGGYGAPEGYPPAPGYSSPAYGSPPPGYGQPPPYQPPYAYPSRRQSPQQVTTDPSECGTWATRQSGYDPSKPGTAAYAASESGPVGTLSLGQTVPGLFGGIERREERRASRRERRDQENQEYASQQSDAYNRALDSCLTARGYTVR